MKLKKVLSMVLSAVIIMSVVPGTVFAADLEQETVEIEDFSDDAEIEDSDETENQEDVKADSEQEASEVEFQEEEENQQENIDATANENQDIVDEFSDGIKNIIGVGEKDKAIIANGDANQNITWTLYDDGELVITGSGDMPEYTEQQLAPWNKYKKQIKHITIEKGITGIGSYAFFRCYDVEAVQMPDEIIYIGYHAFEECSNLLEIKLPGNLKEIKWSAFAVCSSLVKVEFPDGVTSIGSSAFSGCSSLESMKLPDSITRIENSAFARCSSLISVKIPDGVTVIANHTFGECKNLTDVVISKNVTDIQSYAFYDCRKLADITIPPSVETIGSCAFNDCGLRSVEIPEGVERIESDAFGGWSTQTLVGITIPRSVKSLGAQSVNVIRYAGSEEEWKKIKKDSKDYYMYYNYTYDPNHEHKYYKCIAEYASCDKNGEYAWVCELCGKIQKTEIIYGGHSWCESEREEPTCTKNGKILYRCDMCATGRKEEVIPATGHTEVKDEAVEATCEKDGLTEGSHCSVCGEVLTEQKKVPATGHKFTSWKTISQATVFAPEQQSRSCTVCGKNEQREVGSKLQPTITVSATSLPLKTKQKTTVLKVTGLAAGDSIVSWKSNNTKVAKVSGRANGTSTIAAGTKTGKAKITITLKSGLKKVVTVTVQKTAVKTKKITGVAKNLKLKRKQKAVLRPVLAPVTSKQKITYKSSNTKVATVNSKGQITAKKKGTAVITVKSGSKTVKCKVSVK